MNLESAVDAWRKLWARDEGNRNRSNKVNDTRSTVIQKKKKNTRNKKYSYLRNNIYDRSAFTQQTLLGESLEKEDAESFGDLLREKEVIILRVGLQNIQNLPERHNTDKNKKPFNYIKQNEFDIVLTTEVGLDWRVVDIENQLFERT